MVHLRGGLQLVEGNVHRTSPELWKFFRMYFVAHDIMSRTTSESWSEDKTPELWTRNENLEEVRHSQPSLTNNAKPAARLIC